MAARNAENSLTFRPYHLGEDRPAAVRLKDERAHLGRGTAPKRPTSAYPHRLLQIRLSGFVTSFGRRLAYESLRRTNPRAGRSRYGVLVNGPGWECRHRGGDRGCRPFRAAWFSTREHPYRQEPRADATARWPFRHRRAAEDRRPQQGCDRQARYAVPGHGELFPAEHVGRGGARGWVQRSNVSRMIMRPPQQGHGGR